MADVGGRLDQAYRILSGDDSDERSCEAIPESACSDVPRNYLYNLGNGASTKLAEQLAGPNLVLPWVLAMLGTPAIIVGLLMPIKQVGSLAPQLIVSGQIRRMARRQWAWVGAGLVQATMLLLIALAVVSLDALLAGVVVLACFTVFSVASGVGSVAFQDVTGKTIPKGRRGRLLSNRAAVGGVLTLAGGLLIHYGFGDSAGVGVYAGLIVFSALLWALASVFFALLEEAPGATDGGRNAWRELRNGLAISARYPGYRHFLGARGLLLAVELAMPFYALHGRDVFGGEVATLAVFIVTVGLANIISSPIWGYFSDESSRTVLVVSGVLGALAGCLALLVAAVDALQLPILYTSVFIVLGVAEAGVRLGRKTYLIDAAPKDERPLYVAFSNTSIGFLALSGGFLGLIAQVFGSDLLVVVLVLLSGAGAVVAWTMPEAEEMLDRQ